MTYKVCVACDGTTTETFNPDTEPGSAAFGRHETPAACIRSLADRLKETSR